ncbi:MAG: COP23 domain-containing protein [Microcoleus anatoxicus]|uniref:COP23 domain-containing protein n=1 Tax=Microcoleus anatoxicus TaxID=2705319 RepID=UPI00366A739F
MSHKESFLKRNLVINITACAVGIASLGYTIYTGWRPPILGWNDRFYCAAPKDEGDVWKVIYRNEQGEKPWLKIITSLDADKWQPAKRCQAIADRMEDYRKDGLTALDYRRDDNTPGQWVICARTKKTDNCSLLLTLRPDKQDPYKALDEVLGNLKPGTDGYPENSDGGRLPSISPSEAVSINLQPYLAKEDSTIPSTVKK